MRTLLAALALSSLADPAGAASLNDALAAYRQTRVGEAETGFRAVYADPAASAKDRAAAARELARIAWLVDGDATGAKARLAEAEAVGEDLCDTGELKARVLREAGEEALAAAEGRRLTPTCDDPLEADEVRQQVLQAQIALAEAASGAERERLLSEAEATLPTFSADGRADLDANRSAMMLALMRRDAAGLMGAWRRYFWLADRKAPQALASYEDRLDSLFAAGLRADAAPGDQLALVELLIRAGFVEAARRLAADADLAARGGGDPRWARARRYFQFRDEIAARTLAMNRGMARGKRQAKTYYDDLIEKLTLQMTGERTFKAAKATAMRDFGLFGAWAGETSGYPSLHLGHLAQDERRTVEDSGRKGEIRFVVVDGMVANGFESWLWDGWAAAGGWAEDGQTIVQVRPRYTLGPVRGLGLVGDTPARRLVERTIAEREAVDRAAAASGKVVPLAGPQRRMNLQVVDAVAAKARAKGGDFREAFLAEYWRINVDQSIFLHEGRHVLDQAAGKASGKEPTSDQLEFTAKLSELRLGELPKMSLMQIDGDLVGADTSHGRGNAKIVGGLRDWLEAHRQEVVGFDPATPALMQIDKLSDAQIRAAATAMDPWHGARR